MIDPAGADFPLRKNRRRRNLQFGGTDMGLCIRDRRAIVGEEYCRDNGQQTDENPVPGLYDSSLLAFGMIGRREVVIHDPAFLKFSAKKGLLSQREPTIKCDQFWILGETSVFYQPLPLPVYPAFGFKEMRTAFPFEGNWFKKETEIPGR